MLSNYQKVIEFCKTFGHTTHNKPQLDIWKNPETLQFRLDLIEEEEEELKVAVKNEDFKETIDALADLLYVTYGMLATIGVDGDKAMSLVHESNMSKICNTELEAIETVDWYKKEFLENRLTYDSATYRKRDTKWVVFNESTGKILKSIYYFPVDFISLM